MCLFSAVKEQDLNGLFSGSPNRNRKKLVIRIVPDQRVPVLHQSPERRSLRSCGSINDSGITIDGSGSVIEDPEDVIGTSVTGIDASGVEIDDSGDTMDNSEGVRDDSGVETDNSGIGTNGSRAVLINSRAGKSSTSSIVSESIR